ncbi:hypothetical protein [Yinghuangia sp. YIM S09857]|uniref:hypothetical protein n=1 Tax=Yinghuangia sp. YIM S09857 TaxID=3436929 RepID=UPI003F52A26A
MTTSTGCAHTWEHVYMGRSGDGGHTNRWTCAKCAAVEFSTARQPPCAGTPTAGVPGIVAGQVWGALPGAAMTRCARCALVTVRAEAACLDDAHDWPPDGGSRCRRCGHTVLELYR